MLKISMLCRRNRWQGTNHDIAILELIAVEKRAEDMAEPSALMVALHRVTDGFADNETEAGTAQSIQRWRVRKNVHNDCRCALTRSITHNGPKFSRVMQPISGRKHSVAR